MIAIITFVIVFGLIVLVHEFGHYYWAKKSGILVRQFSIGMGPKLVSYTKNHTLYTIRLLPLGGYVMLAGAEDDDEELPAGTIVGLKLNADNKVIQIDNSETTNNYDLIPLQVVNSDLQKDLFIEGYVDSDEQKLTRYEVHHDATIIDKTGAEMQIAPLDVQFNSASLLNRFLTNLAGPFNNIVFGILIYVLSAFIIGGPLSAGNKLGEIQPHSPAAAVHLAAGDQILRVENYQVHNWDQLATTIAHYPNKSITLTVKKSNHQVKHIRVLPRAVKNGSQTIGQIGIMPQRDHRFVPTLKYGFTSAFNSMGIIVHALQQMVSGGFNLNQLGGPVAIYSQTSQVAAMGYKQVIIFIAWLSINLGIMNLLPIPALDGGKLLLNIIEAIRRKPISQKAEVIVNLIGVAFLFGLMIAVTWNDIMRFFIK